LFRSLPTQKSEKQLFLFYRYFSHDLSVEQQIEFETNLTENNILFQIILERGLWPGFLIKNMKVSWDHDVSLQNRF